MEIDSSSKPASKRLAADSSDAPRQLEIIMSLNVIQDSAQDGNLMCALVATASDLLLQIHQFYSYSQALTGKQIVNKAIFSTIALKAASKALIDPQNINESSLSNNLVLVTCYHPIADLLPTTNSSDSPHQPLDP